jgi:uncharacterized protein involved in exopolysaccharide biosynthesis
MSSSADNQSQQQAAPQPVPQGYFIPFPQQEPPDDEINLLDIWQVIVQNKKIIFAITFATTLIAAIAAFSMTPIYRAEVLLAPVSSDAGSKGGLGTLAS